MKWNGQEAQGNATALLDIRRREGHLAAELQSRRMEEGEDRVSSS